ncbi:MAG: hypothetical protein BWY86_01313 [Candidatus Aminicenantes bacterium ADurb.Bin508]|nr:MAG: hypothetical protein BWY86_01313 [Candidatus Aminicenantes bacterium ADurb.Bin508]
MSLFDLVEQDHFIGVTLDLVGELVRVGVTDVARGGADQPRNGILLHVLGHVDPQELFLVSEELLGENLGGLGLSHSRGPEEEEDAVWAERVELQPCLQGEKFLDQFAETVVLAHDSGAKPGLQVLEPLLEGEGDGGELDSPGVGQSLEKVDSVNLRQVHLPAVKAQGGSRAGSVQEFDRLVGKEAVPEKLLDQFQVGNDLLHGDHRVVMV